MANKKSWYDKTFVIFLITAIGIIVVLSFIFSSWFSKASNTPVVTPTVPPGVTVQETAPTPSPPAVRAEVAEVKEHVAKTADDLTETIEEFRKEADELDLGE